MNSIDRHWERARRYLAQGQFGPARVALESMRSIDPEGARTQLLGAELAWQSDRVRDAAEHACRAAQAVTEDRNIVCGIIDGLLQTGETELARACLERAVMLRHESMPLLLRMAGHRQRLGEHAASLALLERIRAIGGDNPDTMYYRGQQLVFNGRLQAADADLEACLRLRPDHGRAAQVLARLRRQTAESNHLQRLDEGHRRAAPGTLDHAALEFARYKELEDLGRWDEAWDALARGNLAMSRRNPGGDAQLEPFLRQLEDTPALALAHSTDQDTRGPQPIFVVGLPRSGSTVLERMLGNHPDIQAAGELQDFGKQMHWMADTLKLFHEGFLERLRDLDMTMLGRRYLERTQWRAQGKSRFVDKQLANWMLLGPIRAALPQARILHMVRKPMDICFSNWRAYFGDTHGYSYQLDTLADHYRSYRRAMAAWHRLLPGAVLDISYSGLINAPQETLRKVLEFCGLPYAPECADISHNAEPVATLSSADVHHGIREHAPSAWLPYAPQLSGLRAALDRAEQATEESAM